MAETYIVTGTKNPSVDGTSEVILSKDEDGTPKKVIGKDKPCDLSDADKKVLDGLGVTYEKATKADVKEAEESTRQQAADTAAAAPVLGDQGQQQQGDGEKSDKNRK